MVLFVAIFLGIIGLFIGSFLGVVIDRLPKQETILVGRSHCSHCRKSIPWYDLFPVVSFLLLNGKCRFCHKPIGSEVFFIELITGIIFFCTGLVVLFPALLADGGVLLLAKLIYDLYILCTFLVIFFIDKKYRIIPNKLVYPAIVVSILYLLLFTQRFLLTNFLSGLIAFLFFFFLFAITRGKGMGFGDVKFVFLLGLFLGFPGVIIALYVAFLTGALIASILIVLGKKKFHGGTIAFGPFLILGGLISFYFGSALQIWFLHFIW